MRSTHPLFLSFMLSAALCVGLTSCNKEEKQAAEQPKAGDSTSATLLGASASEESVLALELLKKIPSSSAGFMAVDLKGDAYQKFLASPWGNQAGGMSFVQMALEELKKGGAEESQVASAQAAIESLKKLGLLSADGKPQIEKVVGEVAIFVDTPPVGNEAAVNAGLFAAAAGTTNLKDKLVILESIIKEAGLPTTKETYAGADGFSVALGAGADGAANPLGSIYFAASEKRFSVSRSKPVVESAFTADSSDGLASLKAAPEFQKAFASMKGGEPSMSVAFLSFQRLLPALEKAAKENATPQTPSEFDAKTFPVEAFVATQGMGSELTSRLALVVTGRTDEQKTVMAALDGATLLPTASKLPSDVAFALSLDTKFLAKLEPLLKDLQAEPAAAEGIKVIKSIQGATIALRNNDAGSPFPDLFISVDATNRDELGKILETTVGQAMASTGGMGAPWQTKDISGTPTRFFATPLGIGAYVASPKDSPSLLIASSERAVKDALSAAAGSTPSLSSTLKSGMNKRISSAKLGLLYLNFTQVANVVDSVKSSLAMFTGGASPLDQQFDSNKIRSWGTSVTAFGFTDGVLKVESSMEAAAAALPK